MEEERKTVDLPENAYRPLKEGESYEPVMSPQKVYPEANWRSVSLGVLMAIYLAQYYQWAYEGLADAILLREWLFGTTPFDTIKL